MLLTDEQLMQDICAGSLPAYELLVQRWRRRMWIYFMRCAGQTQEAEDLCQELFFSIYRKRSRFQTDRSFKAWIYSIATHLFIDKVARKRRKELSLFGTDEKEETPVIAYDPVSRTLAAGNEIGERIERAMRSIPEDLRTVLIMKHYEDLTFKEIAEALHQPESTIKSKIYRALSELRAILEKSGVSEADCFRAIV